MRKTVTATTKRTRTETFAEGARTAIAATARARTETAANGAGKKATFVKPARATKTAATREATTKTETTTTPTVDSTAAATNGIS